VAGKERRVGTLRLPETCKVDFAEEEAEGVDEDMMVRKSLRTGRLFSRGRWAQDE
jgi:hypothetical protein